MPERLAIIGAGLAGLYAARRFSQHYNVTVFEARDRPGGRIHSLNGLDLGPSWVWPHHQRMLALCAELELPLFAQHTEGHALYESFDRVEAFTPPLSSPSGRMVGGLGRLVETVSAQLDGVAIRCETEVKALEYDSEGVVVYSGGGAERFDRVICTLPPRVALANLSFIPPLEAQVRTQLQQTPTWMGHALKCVITFECPFWRSLGLSGFGISHRGPMAEFHDACTAEEAALFGFVHSGAEVATLETAVTEQITRLFGDAAEKATGFYYVDWRHEAYTAVPEDRTGPGGHPAYGLDIVLGTGRVFFAGTECAFEEGGYLEGALRSVDTLPMRLG